MGTPHVVAFLWAVGISPNDIVGGIHRAVVVEVAEYMGHGVGYEYSLRAVGEAGPEGELAKVVERAAPVFGICRHTNEIQFRECAGVAGRDFQLIASPCDELQFAV